jgi:hypothetical protein
MRLRRSTPRVDVAQTPGYAASLVIQGRDYVPGPRRGILALARPATAAVIGRQPQGARPDNLRRKTAPHRLRLQAAPQVAVNELPFIVGLRLGKHKLQLTRSGWRFWDGSLDERYVLIAAGCHCAAIDNLLR